MNMFKIAFVSCLIFTTLSLAPIFAREINLTTLNWQPYIGENQKNLKGQPTQGYVAEVVKTAFERAGHSVNFLYRPWARVVYMSKEGKVDGYFPEYYAKSVEEHAIFSVPFPGGPLGFFKLKKRTDIKPSLKMEDYKGYQIGTVRGYVNTSEFDNATFLIKEPVSKDETNLKKLFAGRIDLFAADKFVGLESTNKFFPGRAKELDFIELQLMELYVCFSLKTPDARELKTAFDYQLNKMKQDGTLKKILNEHGF